MVGRSYHIVDVEVSGSTTRCFIDLSSAFDGKIPVGVIVGLPDLTRYSYFHAIADLKLMTSTVGHAPLWRNEPSVRHTAGPAR